MEPKWRDRDRRALAAAALRAAARFAALWPGPIPQVLALSGCKQCHHSSGQKTARNAYCQMLARLSDVFPSSASATSRPRSKVFELPELFPSSGGLPESFFVPDATQVRRLPPLAVSIGPG